MANNQDLATQLHGWRVARGLTQSELAKRAEIHRVTVANLESGKSAPSLSVLTRLMDALDVDNDGRLSLLAAVGAE